MATLKHAQSSARSSGEEQKTYLRFHTWFDESKAFLGDFRPPPGLTHHAEGIFCGKLFGVAIVNSDGTSSRPAMWRQAWSGKNLGRFLQRKIVLQIKPPTLDVRPALDEKRR